MSEKDKPSYIKSLEPIQNHIKEVAKNTEMIENLPTKPLTDMIRRYKADYDLLGVIATKYLDTGTGVQLESLLKLIGARGDRDWVLREYGRSRNVLVNVLSDHEGVKFVFFSKPKWGFE